MIPDLLRRRLPSIAASLGLFWVVLMTQTDLDRPGVSVVLCGALILVMVVWPKPEIVGVSVAAMLALAAAATWSGAFAVAGGFAVLTLALLAFVERRFRWASVGVAAAAVVVIGFLGPMVVDPPERDTLSNPVITAAQADRGDGWYFENRIESIGLQPDTSLSDPTLRVSDEAIGNMLARSSEIQELAERQVQVEESGTSIWSYLIAVLMAWAVLYLIKRSRANVPLGPVTENAAEPEDLVEQAEFVLKFEALGKKAGVPRETNESILAFGDRLAAAIGNDDFSRAGSMISEQLYGEAGQIDAVALRATLDGLQVDAERPDL